MKPPPIAGVSLWIDFGGCHSIWPIIGESHVIGLWFMCLNTLDSHVELEKMEFCPLSGRICSNRLANPVYFVHER